MKLPHRIAVYAALALALFVLVPAALADKGGAKAGNTSSFSLVLLGAPGAAAASSPQWGQQVTFNVKSDAAYPTVELDCAQSGAWVYAQIVGFYPTFGDQTFTLKSPSWTGGAADCTATLYTMSSSGKRTTLATSGFTVNG
jgi:hypothetical protein